MVSRLQEAFPAILSHWSGSSRTIVDVMLPTFANSIGPSRFSRLLLECKRLEHQQRHLTYLNCYDSNQRQGVLHGVEPLGLFPDFEDKLTDKAVVPSAPFPREQYCNAMAIMIALLKL